MSLSTINIVKQQLNKYLSTTTIYQTTRMQSSKSNMNTASYTTPSGRDATSTNQSHATGRSVGASPPHSLPFFSLRAPTNTVPPVPDKLQQKLPRSVEDSVPNAIHDTGAPAQKGRGVSHATGHSVVPQKLQEALPESVERAVPNFLHDTSEKGGRGSGKM